MPLRKRQAGKKFDLSQVLILDCAKAKIGISKVSVNKPFVV